jgi:outer membrane protein assembly factor BamB
VWSTQFDGGVISTPSVADGVVYVATRTDQGDRQSKLYAFAADCGGPSCAALWEANIGLDGAYGSSPAIVNGVVYVASLDGNLYAFAVGCARNGRTCTPLWIGAHGGSHTSPAVAGGVVYAASDDGRLLAFSVGCGTDGSICDPLWVGEPATPSESIGGSPIVANGVVYVGTHEGRVYAFAVGCGSGGAACAPVWTAPVGGRWVYDRSPAVADGVLYIASSVGLSAWDLGARAPASMAP